MDLSNSGSMQSSSGGDEEYDSRGTESISAYLSQTYPTGHLSPFTNPPPPQQPPAPPPLPPSSSIFDPVFSNYFDPILRSPPPNPLLNLDAVWSKSLRSEPNNCTGINPLMASSSTSSDQPHHTLQAQTAQQENTTSRGSSSTDHHHHQPQPPQQVGGRNPKKRSRASRRAPTTVLTTDTTNFRAMVQEFTGIPAPPFTPTSAFRTRLDLFGTSAGGSTSSATIRGGNTPLGPLQPPYLLRPFAQKIQIQPSLSALPFVSSSTPSSFPIASSSNSAASNNPTPDTTTRASGGNGAGSANGNLLNMHNQILTFLLQPPSSAKYGQPNSDINFGSSRATGSLGIPGMNDSHLKMGLVDEFGLGQAQLGGPSSLVPPPASRGENHNTHNNNDNNNPANWADELGLNDGGQVQPRSVNGNGGATVSFATAAAASNVSGARGEGMVESWICSSD